MRLILCTQVAWLTKDGVLHSGTDSVADRAFYNLASMFASMQCLSARVYRAAQQTPWQAMQSSRHAIKQTCSRGCISSQGACSALQGTVTRDGMSADVCSVPCCCSRA